MEFLRLILGVCLLACGTIGSSDLKSSLTFVIDETDSMDTVIEKVTEKVDDIVDTVKNSSATPIEEFVLVTFSYGATLVTKTSDKAEFKGNITDINVGASEKCPKTSLTAIELALNESRDGSLLYVFTDATAEDYNKSAKIQALGQKKAVQIVFILTGVCNNDKASPGYKAYQDISRATNGQVFHLEKQDIGEILKYVENNVVSRKNVLASKIIPAGGSTFDVNVDGDITELVIAVSGRGPSVFVTLDGAEGNLTDITKLQDITVVKLAVKPGVYRVGVASRSESHAVVSASTSVLFQHGFSTFSPSSINDTTRRPVPRTVRDPEPKSYLSIQLSPGASNVKLDSAQILDMDDKVLHDYPLKTVNKDEHFYTTEPFGTPSGTFKVAIKGYDTKKQINITRYAITPIQAQSNEPGIGKMPEVSIEGAPTVNASFYKPLKLKCIVNAWPVPAVIWESSNTLEKLIFSPESKVVEYPYEYISILEIPKVTKNATYTCNATNTKGDAVKPITVQTVETYFIEVEVKDVTIEYKKEGKIRCNVNAYPEAKVSWYKDHSALKPNENLVISADGTLITVKSMEPNVTGNYYCLAKNSVDKVVKPLKVKISGVGPPKIDKASYQVNAELGADVDISCNVTAVPNATLHWSFKNSTSFVDLNETSDILKLENIDTSFGGVYICKAQNEYGIDYHGIELIVEYEPLISSNASFVEMKATAGELVVLNCSSDGVPEPNITWTHNGRLLDTIDRYHLYKNGSLGFSALETDRGEYRCLAENVLGNEIIFIKLEIILPVDFESPKISNINQGEGKPLLLECNADGTPQPNITWLYRKTPKDDIIELPPNEGYGNLKFRAVHHGQSGEYTCVATNEGGSKNITYNVTVTAPPSILPTMREFNGVEGDMYLRVPCDATGNPKPEIIWTNSAGDNLASHTEWYLVAEDGSLIIKNVSQWAAGDYTCTAFNVNGSVSERFRVVVNSYPIERFLSIQLEEGKSANIPCSVPHRLTDRLRWFKDYQPINSTVLHNVTMKDEGTYTCRVSSVDRFPQSGTTRVEVGFKPRFRDDRDSKIPYRNGGFADMDCTVEGKPTPQVSWLKNGVAIDVYMLQTLGAYEPGSYSCVAKNQYGYAQKDFIVE